MEIDGREKRKERIKYQILKEIAILEGEQRERETYPEFEYMRIIPQISRFECLARSFTLPSKCTERRVGEGKSKLDLKIPDITLR